jgi:hypothetical protein
LDSFFKSAYLEALAALLSAKALSIAAYLFANSSFNFAIFAS